MSHPFLIDQLRRIHRGGAWHGPSLSEALDGVTPAQAYFRPIADAHTIFELTHHCASWAEEATARLGGRTPREPDAGDFPDLSRPHTDASWAAALARLKSAHDALELALAALAPSQMQHMVGSEASAPLGTGVTYEAMAHGVVQHDAYHAGQIMLLRRAMTGRV